MLLKQFDQKSAKKPVRRKGGAQQSLFGVGAPSRSRVDGTPLAGHDASFKTVAPMWSREGHARVDAEQVPDIQAEARRLSQAISERLACHYAPLKRRIANAADVAAYFVLREVETKAEAETPGLIVEALDFGVSSLKGG